eukprot:13553341-Alexandrium_andersonii.AAC.1
MNRFRVERALASSCPHESSMSRNLPYRHSGQCSPPAASLSSSEGHRPHPPPTTLSLIHI